MENASEIQLIDRVLVIAQRMKRELDAPFLDEIDFDSLHEDIQTLCDLGHTICLVSWTIRR